MNPLCSRLPARTALLGLAMLTVPPLAHTAELTTGTPEAQANKNWSCHIIQPDPNNHGPDGINVHDWDGDGHLDVFSNFEEGEFSRLYFNPGPKKVRQPWSDFIEFKHSNCEDSGAGDLDNDGDIDYVANGGLIYFNPGKASVREASAWTKMTLFNHERRVPVIADLDGDGLHDLIVGAQEWYRQPAKDKHVAENWIRYQIGKNRWPMNCILADMDADGDPDLVVPDRGVEVCWYENPGRELVRNPWRRRQLHPHHEPMFMTVADVNGDTLHDFVITGGSKGDYARKLIILLRQNKRAKLEYVEIVLDQPSGNFPKGVAVLDGLAGNPNKRIVVIPKQGDLWTASCSGNGMERSDWRTNVLHTSKSETRKKMDNAWIADIDSDGIEDILTTEENGGWGVIWFENPN